MRSRQASCEAGRMLARSRLLSLLPFLGRSVAWLSAAPLPAACSTAPGVEVPATRQAVVAELPPFALQYAGRYAPDDAASDLWSLDLYPTGEVRWASREALGVAGVWSAEPRARSLPLELRLATATETLDLTIRTYDGFGTLRRGREVIPVHPLATVGPDEAVCDQSRGAWTDDDPDPSTGLYCLCGPGRAYVPSAGGCIAPAERK